VLTDAEILEMTEQMAKARVHPEYCDSGEWAGLWCIKVWSVSTKRSGATQLAGRNRGVHRGGATPDRPWSIPEMPSEGLCDGMSVLLLREPPPGRGILRDPRPRRCYGAVDRRRHGIHRRLQCGVSKY